MEQLQRQTAHFRPQPAIAVLSGNGNGGWRQSGLHHPHTEIRWRVGAYLVVGRPQSRGLGTGRKRVARRGVAGKPANIASFSPHRAVKGKRLWRFHGRIEINEISTWVTKIKGTRASRAHSPNIAPPQTGRRPKET